MAAYQTSLQGEFDHFVHYIKNEVLNRSSSASLEEELEERLGQVRCCLLAFERYSFTGSNRVSLSVTILGAGQQLEVMAAATGGSQAMFFKVNTWGEESFLDTLVEAVENYQ
ncbi:MAG TPA: hypothetical protein IAB98_08065 [Candidatus Egerieimonas intestinavium]|uniref:Uncharacterized protein n=1 Tax=Candidatus Egerieimonas intestinavium TaxID=2840777 RepID=A0A9D1JFX4_9FIRM|nr:hypothetical protein [Candidatus Egerieimonas intestinavium]